VIRTQAGGELSLVKKQVERHVVRKEAEVKYEEYLHKMQNTVEDHQKMADWCLKNGLDAYREYHMQEILKLDPNYEPARLALGYIRRFWKEIAMAVMQWVDAFVLDNGRMDETHREYVDLLNTLDEAADGVTVSNTTATAVTLTGSVSDLSTWLNAGKLRLRTDAARTVGVELRRAAAAGTTLSMLDAALVATGGFDVALHQPSSTRYTSPSVSLPGRLATVPNQDSALTFGATAFGTAPDNTLTVTLATSSGSINVTELDPECAGVDHVLGEAREADVRVALSNVFGFGGHNATLAFRRLED